MYSANFACLKLAQPEADTLLALPKTRKWETIATTLCKHSNRLKFKPWGLRNHARHVKSCSHNTICAAPQFLDRNKRWEIVENDPWALNIIKSLSLSHTFFFISFPIMCPFSVALGKSILANIYIISSLNWSSYKELHCGRNKGCFLWKINLNCLFLLA